MKRFRVTVRTAGNSTTYTAIAASSGAAYAAAADQLGDTPCGITVTPA